MGKQLKMCLLGDPHYRLSSVKSHQKLTELVLDWIKEEKEQAGDVPIIMCIMGDLCDNHKVSFMKPYMMATDLLFRASEILPTYLLIGNHDRADNTIVRTNEHFFEAHKLKKNLTIVDKGIVEEINGFKLAFVPYLPVGTFREHYNDIVGDHKIDVVLCHQEFRNVKMGIITSAEGDRWSKKTDPQVFTGHIHEHQILGNVYNVGTPLQQAFNEDYNSKGVTTVVMSRQENGKPSFDVTRLRLNIPPKITITISASEFMDFRLPKGEAEIKLFVEGEPAELKALYSLEKYKKLKKKCKILCREIKISRPQRKYKGHTYIDMVYETLKERQRDYLHKLITEKKDEKEKATKTT